MRKLTKIEQYLKKLDAIQSCYVYLEKSFVKYKTIFLQLREILKLPVF